MELDYGRGKILVFEWMKMKIEWAEGMRKFAKECASQYKKIFLLGDLGAGKTTFVQGFLEGLGHSSEIVHSPTYTYLNIYHDSILHLDLYRLEEKSDFIAKGILDQILSYEIVLVEWPRFEELYKDENRVTIEIKKMSDTEREIQLSRS